MDKIDSTKSYRFTDGTKIKSIKRMGDCSGSWDNRGGGKAAYELVLEDGTVRHDWYYHTGQRTGEKGPAWDHPDNLISEEKYQSSVFKCECGCETKEVAVVNRHAQFMLQFPCSKCGLMYELEGAREERTRKQKAKDVVRQAASKLIPEREEKLRELKKLKKIAANKNIAAEERLKMLRSELTKIEKNTKALMTEQIAEEGEYSSAGNEPKLGDLLMLRT